MKSRAFSRKVCICGAFDFDGMLTGGQHTKTRELYYSLRERLGEENVLFVDTQNWKKHPIKLLLNYFKCSRKAKHIIMLPSSNGLKVLPLLLVFSKLIAKKKIYYDVIGGTLHRIVPNKRFLKTLLKSFDGIWVEGKAMQESLFEQGLCNVTFVRNFKLLTPININAIDMPTPPFFKLCTFSRVVLTKGITDAIKAVVKANELLGQPIYSLDIYGHIGDEYREEFEGLLQKHSSLVKYVGLVQPHDSIDVLKRYFMLLFPTYFSGEGMPGTLIDAFAAGVPTIASDWHCNSEIIEDQYTGFILPPQSVDVWAEKLVYCFNNYSTVNNMRVNCRREYDKFTKEVITDQILDLMNIEV